VDAVHYAVNSNDYINLSLQNLNADELSSITFFSHCLWANILTPS